MNSSLVAILFAASTWQTFWVLVFVVWIPGILLIALVAAAAWVMNAVIREMNASDSPVNNSTRESR